MASADAKNLEAIAKAIDQHNQNCPFPAAEVRMNPFEVERLGWDEIRGLPVLPDSEIGTGRFRIICSQELDGGARRGRGSWPRTADRRAAKQLIRRRICSNPRIARVAADSSVP